ncbi:ribonuclease H-like domain-containing protein [Tanacetum coccineum]|uniref:Ribonuclease H-like domain-containing protein n=1 Tax=Tanacetum coccineum TaxID=301880 RepID=A0ABQ5IA36_9ASTR
MFSPIIKPTTIRIVLSLALSRGWHVHQLDVKNTFINDDLSETIYMYQPPGFVDSHFPHHVCQLQRSLYGLKHAPRAWFQRFASYALRVGFSSTRCDSSLFIYCRGTEVAYLLVYVDDIVLATSSTTLLQCIISSLHQEFETTDLGAINYFLGIAVTRDSTVKKIYLYMHNPREPHLAALKRIIRYVRGTLDLCLQLFASSTGSLIAYSDADWAGCPSTRRSTSGYCMKHIEMDIRFVRDMVTKGHVRVLHVPSRYQYADIFTKGLSSALFEEFRTSLSVRSSPAPTAGESEISKVNGISGVAGSKVSDGKLLQVVLVSPQNHRIGSSLDCPPESAIIKGEKLTRYHAIISPPREYWKPS